MLNLLGSVLNRNLSVLFFAGFLTSSVPVASGEGSVPAPSYNVEKPVKSAEEISAALYSRIGVAGLGLKQEIFEQAVNGWNRLKEQQALGRSAILTIVDMSQSANKKRMYIIDMEQGKLLFNSLVAHGRNSGEEFARNFSNAPESYKSSLGFYVTGDTYSGKHGLSLRLRGLESGLNDNAENRAIVIHGADYVSEQFIRQHGRLGRSQGCPAVPVELSKPIIDEVKGGTCLFIYSDQYNQTVAVNS